MLNFDQSQNIENMKILIISSSDTESNLVGANYIKAYFNKPESVDYDHFRVAPIGGIKTRYSPVLNRLKSWGLVSSLLFTYWKSKHQESFLDAIRTKFERENYDSVVIFLNSPELIELAPALIAFFQVYKIKVVVGIWDCFEYLTENRRLTERVVQRLKCNYIESLVNADFLMVISDGMRSHLEDMFSERSLQTPKCLVLPFPLSRPLEKKTEPLRRETIDIVFAGSTYCWKEWNYFIKRLDEKDWIIGGKKILLHVYGKPNIKSALYSRRRNIIVHPQLPHHDLVKEISRYSMGYVPYFLSEKKKTVAMTSLPGKLSLYLEAGLPTLFHGPGYSEAANIIEKFGIGVLYTNETNTSLESCIKKIDRISYSNILRCFEEVYSLESLHNKLYAELIT